MIVEKARLFLDRGYTVRVHIFGERLTVSFVKDKMSFVGSRIIVHVIGNIGKFQRICEELDFYPVTGKWIKQGEVLRIITIRDLIFERFIDFCLKNYKLKFDEAGDSCYTIYFEVKKDELQRNN